MPQRRDGLPERDFIMLSVQADADHGTDVRHDECDGSSDSEGQPAIDVHAIGAIEGGRAVHTARRIARFQGDAPVYGVAMLADNEMWKGFHDMKDLMARLSAWPRR